MLKADKVFADFPQAQQLAWRKCLHAVTFDASLP